MGCCDSKEARRDNFAGPGRVLGSAPEQRTSAPLPSNTSQSYGTTPGRTLGSGHDDGDPRARAALAAEARASKPKGGSKLEQDLASQKKGGMQAALRDASDQNRRQREIDAAQDARNWS